MQSFSGLPATIRNESLIFCDARGALRWHGYSYGLGKV